MAIVGSLCALTGYSTVSGRTNWMCPLILQNQASEYLQHKVAHTFGCFQELYLSCDTGKAQMTVLFICGAIINKECQEVQRSWRQSEA